MDDRQALEKTPDRGLASGEPRKKRWATKVRSGCATCRARRIKCDEGKPDCRRCLLGGRKCDGYDRPAAIPRATQSLPQFNSTADVRDLLLLIPLVTITLHHTELKHVTDRSTFILAHGQQMASYMMHLPCRAGHDKALDSAVMCVVSALRQTARVLNSPHRQSADATSHPLSLYTSALRNLQAALEDPKRSQTAETLCATELLCVFECVSIDTKNQASIKHARGASQLIRHRGPKQFKTGFDMSLLTAQMPLLIGDAFFDGRHCFLEGDEWQETIQASISHSGEFPYRSETLISLYNQMFHFPGLMADVTAFVDAQDTSYSAADHEALLDRVQVRRKGIKHWYENWGRHVFGSDPDDFMPSISPDDARIEFFITYQTFVMTGNRLYIALGGDDSWTAEVETQKIAKEIYESPAVRGGPLTKISFLSSLVASRAALETAARWETCIRPPEGAKVDTRRTRKLASEGVFHAWFDIATSWVSK